MNQPYQTIGGAAACSLDRCSTSVGLAVVTKKTVDGFLRFCIHAWFSDDFLQPRCFPRDLYTVNIAENVECIFLFLPFSSSDDREKSFPGCRWVVSFLRNHLWICDDAITTGDSCVKSSGYYVYVFKNLFKFLL